MSVKKIIFSCLCFVCLMAVITASSGYCASFPKIAFNRVAIGGIQPFATKNYVRSIYGEPNKIIDRRDPKLHRDGDPDEDWVYGDTLIISFAQDTVFCIISSGPNGLKTPDGIAVGDSEAKLISAYGRKWKLGYWFKSDYDTNFTFHVKNGKVSRIFAGWNL